MLFKNITTKGINIEQRKICDLKPHNINEDIYGKDEDVSDLVDSIRKTGIISPIEINNENMIISGNRRYQAAKQLGTSIVPVIVNNYEDGESEIEALIIANTYRIKTLEQKVREGLALEEVMALRSKKRMAHNTNIGYEYKGRTSDEIAKKVGFGSGRQYDRAKNVIKKIDKMNCEGRADDAELLTNLLNKAPSTADEFIKKVNFNELDDDIKRDIRDKKISAHSVIQMQEIKRSDTNNFEQKKEIIEKCSNREIFVDDIFKEFSDMKRFLSEIASSGSSIKNATHKDRIDINTALKEFEEVYDKFKSNIFKKIF